MTDAVGTTGNGSVPDPGGVVLLPTRAEGADMLLGGVVVDPVVRRNELQKLRDRFAVLEERVGQWRAAGRGVLRQVSERVDRLSGEIGSLKGWLEDLAPDVLKHSELLESREDVAGVTRVRAFVLGELAGIRDEVAGLSEAVALLSVAVASNTRRLGEPAAEVEGRLEKRIAGIDAAPSNVAVDRICVSPRIAAADAKSGITGVIRGSIPDRILGFFEANPGQHRSFKVVDALNLSGSSRRRGFVAMKNLAARGYLRWVERGLYELSAVEAQQSEERVKRGRQRGLFFEGSEPERVVRFFEDHGGQHRAADVSRHLGFKAFKVARLLSRLTDRGHLRRVERGLYELAAGAGSRG